MLALNVALDQRVFELQCDQAVFRFFFRERVGTGCVPGWRVRKPIMENLALSDKIIQSRNNFFYRGDRVPGMKPVKIDEVSIQTPQGAVKRAVDILTAIPTRVRIALFLIECELGRQYHAIAQLAVGDEFADHLFTLSARVAI